MRNPAERLRDILEAIDRIQERCGGGRSAFDADEMLQVWVLHHLQVIGESSRSLREDFRNSHPDVPWQRIIGMRHILVHHYFDVDTEVVWQVVANDLPQLRLQIALLLARLTNDSDSEAT